MNIIIIVLLCCLIISILFAKKYKYPLAIMTLVSIIMLNYKKQTPLLKNNPNMTYELAPF